MGITYDSEVSTITNADIKKTYRARRAFTILILGLWSVSVGCVMPSAAFANMPQPVVAPDDYLVGVNKIIIWTSTVMDSDYIKYEMVEHKFPALDYPALNQSIANELRADLPANVRQKVEVQAEQNTVLQKGDKNTDEHALILRFLFGYSVSKLGDREVVLGAVYPFVERLRPMQKGNENLQRAAWKPIPFLATGDKVTVDASVTEAVKKCAVQIVPWVIHHPLEVSQPKL